MLKIDEQVMRETAGRISNWGKWGTKDEIGTVNYIKPEHIKAAAQLVKDGKVFALGLNMDANGPQSGREGRNNPIHTMTWTGTDVVTGRQDVHRFKPHGGIWHGCNFADDYVTMPPQCATHWDALGHIFYKDTEKNQYFMFNGFSPANVDATGGCNISGIEKFKNKMIGRGILLDMARYKRKSFLEPGEGISNTDLDACTKKQGVEVHEGDFLLVRTGDLDRRLREKKWGTYCGGEAPGLEFETIIWLYDKKVAAVATDTWGVEVIPNRSDVYAQPWHQLCIPMAGLTMGENFRLDELADACNQDKRYEFLFVAPPLLITGGTASPINPYAVL
jgi:kynurenine formamidase